MHNYQLNVYGVGETKDMNVQIDAYASIQVEDVHAANNKMGELLDYFHNVLGLKNIGPSPFSDDGCPDYDGVQPLDDDDPDARGAD